MLRTFLFSTVTFLLLPFCLNGQVTNEAILQATAAMNAEMPRAQADPARPVFHITSPAQWMNDPNGPIFYKGYYHLFYQLNPLSDDSGPRALRYWGHVRSRDLVKWEPLPIALWPSSELGEESIWSGCCTINGDGQPMAFYTSIGIGKNAFDQAVQWAAIGDKNLITWQKSPANPVLSEAVNDGTKIYDWRDPFIFHDGKKTFLVAGGHLKKDGDAAVNIYEAQNSALTKWKYRGVLFEIPDAPTAECPNFFKLGDQWVLVVSPYGKVQYFVGDFDAATCRFHPRTRGLLDYGPSFYAPNTMQVPDGRRIVWGWLMGFPGGRGWNGCLSLPRQLSLSRDGELLQQPAPQLAKLRCEGFTWHDIHLNNDVEISATNEIILGRGHDNEILWLPQTNTFEIKAEVDLQSATNFELQIKNGAHDSTSNLISFNGSEIQVLDTQALLTGNDRKLNLHVFIDRSVLEVFANDKICIAKIIPTLKSDAVVEVRAHGGTATIKKLQAWPLKTIW
jgi:beta-fructofuranosidase